MSTESLSGPVVSPSPQRSAVEARLGPVREPRRSEALPGELKPLPWAQDRGPITDEEALGVLRRRRRVDLAGAPKARGGRRSPVPAELPSPEAAKKPTMFRLPPRLVARAHARAEMEQVPLTAVIEELLADYAAGVPDAPDVVRDRLNAKGLRIGSR